MKKTFLLPLLILIYFPLVSAAQESLPDTSGIQHGKVYEIKLKAPVKCIQHIEYDKSGAEPNWKLSEDNQTIFIRDYIINTRIKLRVVYENGREEEFFQSPCTIRYSQSQPAL